jgi:putative ABC transport system permease protein
MGFFYSRLAWQSVRRSPGLSAVMIVGLALGVGTWVTARAGIQGALRNPLPDKKALYNVSLVRPSLFAGVPAEPRNDGRLEAGPRFSLSEPDVRAIAAASPAPTRMSPTFAAPAAVRAADGGLAIDVVRFATRGLFDLFDLRFATGGPWTTEEDATGSLVVVIDEDTARARFGTAAALGKTIEIAGQPFRVLAGGPTEKLYDQVYFRRETERYFAPFESHRRAHIDLQAGFDGGRRASSSDEPRLEDRGLLLWAELPNPRTRAAFVADLKAAGLDASVLPFGEFRTAYYQLHPAYFLFELFALVTLIASALNLVRLLLAKFSARTDLSGIHRALGATRRTIVMVHIIEAKIIGLAAGLIGLALGAVGAWLLNLLIPDRIADAVIDPTAVLVTVAVAVGVGIIAGLYPAWRATRQAPAVFLRQA